MEEGSSREASDSSRENARVGHDNTHRSNPGFHSVGSFRRRRLCLDTFVGQHAPHRGAFVPATQALDATTPKGLAAAAAEALDAASGAQSIDSAADTLGPGGNAQTRSPGGNAETLGSD